MRRILPGMKEPLYITAGKSTAIVATLMALVAIAVLIPAGGHPPGVVFVPFVLSLWLFNLVIIWVTGFIVRKLKSNRPDTRDEDIYTVSMVIVCVLLYMSAANSLFSIRPAGAILAVFTYAVLLGTFLHKGWARYLTIFYLALPILAILLSVFRSGWPFDEITIRNVLFLASPVISAWLIYAYLLDSRVSQYFRG